MFWFVFSIKKAGLSDQPYMYDTYVSLFSLARKVMHTQKHSVAKTKRAKRKSC